MRWPLRCLRLGGKQDLQAQLRCKGLVRDLCANTLLRAEAIAMQRFALSDCFFTAVGAGMAAFLARFFVAQHLAHNQATRG